MESDFPRQHDAGDTLTTLVDVVRDGAAPRNPPAGDPRLIGRRLEDRYEILRALDSGGMATVYVALDHRLDREVAVKVMHPSLAHDPAFVARFRREARAAASIRHRNVVAVTDAGEDGDVVFLVMELVRGRTLRDLLCERGRLSPGQALEVADAVLSALDAAHSTGLMHRDVKPENVLLGDDGSIAVADFGLARAVEASALTTQVGLLMGTVAYVAPEQVSRGIADARSDVYAAGIVLSEMLTGEVPYTRDTPLAVAYAHVHERVPAPSTVSPDLPTEVDDLVLRATARDPAERFADAGAFGAAVRLVRRDPALRARGGDTRRIVLPDTRPAARSAVRPVQPAVRRARTAVLEPDRLGDAPAEPAARARRRRWPWAVAILLALSAGAGVGGWLLGTDARTHVPALSGQTLTAYEDSLTAAHLTWTLGAPLHSDTVATGHVVTTVPVPGTAVKPHTSVVVQTSVGVLMLTVPKVAGQPQAAAAAALVQAGFPPPTAKPAPSDTVNRGQVISTDPAAGTAVVHRTRITLTVSNGPAPVTVPDETTHPLAAAQKALSDLGLHSTVTQAFSDTVQSGSVISQRPGPGTAHRGDTVTLTVSKGPQLVTVPNVIGENGNQAAQQLRAAGLVPREIALLGIHGGTVVTQVPRDGKVKPGSTVTYYSAY